MTYNTNERESALTVLMKSDAMRVALAAEDSKRMAAHQAALDALLNHEAIAGEIEAAAAQVEDARAKLAPIATKYAGAAQAVRQAETNLNDLQNSRAHQASRLRWEAARHVPPVVHATEAGLYYAWRDIHGALDVQPYTERVLSGGTRTRWETNQALIDAALAQVQAMRDLLDRLTLAPMPAAEIAQTLSTEAVKLIDLARICGAQVAHHLPEEIRPAFSEMPERRGRYFPHAA